jgi:hypothetical protein
VAGRLEPSFVSWKDVVRPDPVIGWRPRPNVDAYYLTDAEPEVFHVRTDPQGWTGSGTVAGSDVVVFGDSFAFGYGIDSRAAFFSQPGPARIKAVGATAYNMVQELLLMRELADELAGKQVVWFICLGNDLLQNLVPSFLHYPTPFVRQDAPGAPWEIVTRHVGRPWPFPLAAFRDHDLWLRLAADLHAPTLLAERAYSACEYLIDEGRRLCRAIDAQLTVMTLPDPWHLRPVEWNKVLAHSASPASCDAQRPDKELGEICARLGVSFLAGRDFLTSAHYKAVDQHWNAHGHREVASVLHRLLPDPAAASRRGIIPRGAP